MAKLRHVTLLGESFVNARSRRRTGYVPVQRSSWLSSASTLAISSLVSAVVGHDTHIQRWAESEIQHEQLSSLLLRFHLDYGSFGMIGSRGSEALTGVIAPWLIGNLSASPVLNLIVPDMRSDEVKLPQEWWNKPQLGLAIRSYGQGERIASLYHIRCNATVVRPFLLSDQSATATDFLYPASPDGKYYDRIDRDPTRPVEMIDLTYYDGKSLPHDVLKDIYTTCMLDRDWVEGQRGLALPEQGWAILDEWYGTQ